MTIRPSTPEDFDLFAERLPYRVRAWTGEQDGKVLGIGGVYLAPDGTVGAWLQLLPGAERYPVTLHKTALRFLDDQKQRGVKTIVAMADDLIPSAERWLQRLGFEPVLVEEKKVYRWQAQNG